MTDLTGRTVLVAGGSGNVGEGIVARLRAAGATVVVPTRRPGDAARLLGDDVVVVEGSLGSEGAAAALRGALAARGVDVTDVVASIGSWWSGPPVGELDQETYDRVIASRMGAHFTCANAFLPVLVRADVDRPTYTFINGGAAKAPARGSGLVSMSAAGQLMLGRVVAAEQADGPIAVTTLVIGTPVLTRDRPEGEPHWISAEQIGDVCVAVAGGADLDPVVELGSADQAAALARG